MTISRPTTVPMLEEMLSRRLKTAMAGIPHIHGAGLECAEFTRAFGVTFRFRGWSPTLHGTDVRRTETLHLTQEAIDEALDHFTTTFDALADLQRSRVADAARLGYDRPLPTREIDHLDVDVALPRLRGDGPDATREAVLNAIRRAHSSSTTYHGGNALKTSGVLLGDSMSDDGSRWRRVCAPNVRLRSATGEHLATLRAFELDVHADHRPGDVLAKFVGRPLGDLMPVHPTLDQRIVRKVSNRTWKSRPGLIVGLDMDVEPIGDVLGPRSAAA